jgi:signal peptidase I
MRSTKGYVEKDVVAPLLQLEQEYVQINTQSESIVLEGKVEDYDSFTINDTPVSVEGDHTFKYDYALKEGMNIIDIVAKDKAGNESVYTATVNRIIPEEKPIPWSRIIPFAIIAVLAVLYIYDIVKKNFFGAESNQERKKTGKKSKTGKKQTKTEPLTTEEKKRRMNGFIKDMTDLLAPVILLVILLTQVIQVTVIQSASMEPTLMTGNTVFVNRLAYKTGHSVERGDIVILWSDEYNEYLGKRVIGLPGDEIEFRDGYVVINGQYTDESSYIASDVETNCAKTFTVPDNCYFVLGDNRENSNDSRFWMNPYIPKEDIVGKYMGQIDFSFQYDIFHNF